MVGTFVAQDLILFFVFFEVVLLPMYFMIGVWGGEQRQYASIKFFLYTLFGSALMIVSFLASTSWPPARAAVPLHTFDMPALARWHGAGLTTSTGMLIFGGMFMGFGIKVPMFPFHTWLPDAHTQAPTQGSVILAAVLLKLGTYGFIRIAIPILPDAAQKWAPFIGALAVIGIIYGALGCLAQTDMKRLIAFSSVAHMGFVMLGIATLTTFGINAAIFGMVAHGLITGMLFFLAGSVKERFHTLEIKRLGGLLLQAPHMGWILGFCVMASLGLPGLAGFWGEFPAILSAYSPPPGSASRSSGCTWSSPPSARSSPPATCSGCLQRVAFGTPKEECDDDRIARHAPHRLPRLGADAGADPRPRHLPEPHLPHHRRRRRALADGARKVAEPCSPPCWPQSPGFTAPHIDWHALAPEAVLTVTVVVLLAGRPVHRAGAEVAGVVARRHRPARPRWCRCSPWPSTAPTAVMFGGAYVGRQLRPGASRPSSSSPATSPCCSPPTTSPRATTGRASTTCCCCRRCWA